MGACSCRCARTATTGEALVGFLRVLLRKIAGKLLVIWDGSPIHHGQAVKDFLSAGAAKRLHLERLPGYAPDLNPDEGIWNYLKRVELGNVCATDLGGPASPPAARSCPRAPQARHHPRLLTTMRLLALVPSAEISRFARPHMGTNAPLSTSSPWWMM